MEGGAAAPAAAGDGRVLLELGDLLFEDWNEDAAFGCRSPEEIRADAFARHLLVPVEGVKEFLGRRGSVSESDLSSVVQRFLVSPQMATIAMRDAGYVDAVTSGEWMAMSNAAAGDPLWLERLLRNPAG